MTSDFFPCVVIGAGVVGISVARELAGRGLDVLVLEAGDRIGEETSSRNSEVIHAGIYYPTDSLKARLCLEGRELLYDYCARREIPHRRCGKLIVATDVSQEPALQAIARQAEANGVTDLRWLDGAEARALEPDIRAQSALLSPSTGIIDSHRLMLSLRADAEASGALFVMRAPVLGGEVTEQGIVLDVGGTDPCRLRVDWLVNAAGLGACDLAARLRGFPRDRVPRAYFAKGNYFALRGRSRFQRLIYPIPEPGGLGVHITLDLAGQVRFGPDVEWVDRPDYQLDESRARNFYQSIRRYWPGLPDEALVPAYVGVRPKISGPQEPAADFLIQGPRDHGIKGLVNLFGIESPGLTSCLALARETAARLLAAP